VRLHDNEKINPENLTTPHFFNYHLLKIFTKKQLK